MNNLTGKKGAFVVGALFLLITAGICCGEMTEAGKTSAWSSVQSIFRGGPFPWTPAQGKEAKYKYQYFPSAQVYYDPVREVFFYRSADQWIKSPSLPGDLRNRLGDFVVLDMGVSDPTTFHSEVVKVYPENARVVKRKSLASRPVTSSTPATVSSKVYHYYYYPESRVYYDPDRQIYFYAADGGWKQSKVLPPKIQSRLGRHTIVEMNTDTPEEYHSEVEKMRASKTKAASTGRQLMDSPSWEPRSNEPSYEYLYYPAAFVYFDPNRDIYFYRTNSSWISSPHLPENISKHKGHPVTLRMKTAVPYEYHSEVIRKYPHPSKAVDKPTVIYEIHKKNVE